MPQEKKKYTYNRRPSVPTNHKLVAALRACPTALEQSIRQAEEAKRKAPVMQETPSRVERLLADDLAISWQVRTAAAEEKTRTPGDPAYTFVGGTIGQLRAIRDIVDLTDGVARTHVYGEDMSTSEVVVFSKKD